jgi:alpha-beta hydrolase superfamily lysophospholipase
VTLSLADGADTFDFSCVHASDPAGIVLFAVGGGGDPLRHAPLLDLLASRGLTVVAPHFARLLGPRATSEELIPRARRLRAALAAVDRADLPVIGIGHSIGAATLLGLAGGRMWLDASGPLPIEREPRLERLALLAPPTGFFMAPGALGEVGIPLLVVAGSEDTITPPAQAEFVRRELAGRVPVELQIAQGAGHFSFMHVPPPHTAEPLGDRDGFLAQLVETLAAFALEGATPGELPDSASGQPTPATP